MKDTSAFQVTTCGANGKFDLKSKVRSKVVKKEGFSWILLGLRHASRRAELR